MVWKGKMGEISEMRERMFRWNGELWKGQAWQEGRNLVQARKANDCKDRVGLCGLMNLHHHE